MCILKLCYFALTRCICSAEETHYVCFRKSNQAHSKDQFRLSAELVCRESYIKTKKELLEYLDNNESILRGNGVNHDMSSRFKLACATNPKPPMMHKILQYQMKEMVNIYLEGYPEKDEEFARRHAAVRQVLLLRQGCTTWRYGTSGNDSIMLQSWLACNGDGTLAKSLNAARFCRLNTCNDGSSALDEKLGIVHELFMEAYFVKQKSTVKDAGTGLFLQKHLKLNRGFQLPYTGTIACGRSLTNVEIEAERSYLFDAGKFIIASTSDTLSYMNMSRHCNTNQFGFASHSGLIKLYRESRVNSQSQLVELFVNYGGDSYQHWKHITGGIVKEQTLISIRNPTSSSRSRPPIFSIQRHLVPKYFDTQIGVGVVNELERVGIAGFECSGFEEDVKTAILSYSIDGLCDAVVQAKKASSSLMSISSSNGKRKYFYYDEMFKENSIPHNPAIGVLKNMLDGPLRKMCHELMELIDQTVQVKLGHSIPGHECIWKTVGVISLPGAGEQNFHGDVAPQINSLSAFATSQSTLSVLGER